MRWQTISFIEQKLLFIKIWQSGNFSMTSLCDRFNISRTSGYKLTKRFLEKGEGCLRLNSIAPYSNAHKTPKKIDLAIVNLK